MFRLNLLLRMFCVLFMPFPKLFEDYRWRWISKQVNVALLNIPKPSILHDYTLCVTSRCCRLWKLIISKNSLVVTNWLVFLSWLVQINKLNYRSISTTTLLYKSTWTKASSYGYFTWSSPAPSPVPLNAINQARVSPDVYRRLELSFVLGFRRDCIR